MTAVEAGQDAALSFAVIGAYLEYRKRAVELGKWPDSLEAAGVEVLDPYSGQPLRSRRAGKALQIWSVGMNMKDDGGLTEREAAGSDADQRLHGDRVALVWTDGKP